jgi:hypothetical protein
MEEDEEGFPIIHLSDRDQYWTSNKYHIKVYSSMINLELVSEMIKKELVLPYNPEPCLHPMKIVLHGDFLDFFTCDEVTWVDDLREYIRVFMTESACFHGSDLILCPRDHQFKHDRVTLRFPELMALHHGLAYTGTVMLGEKEYYRWERLASHKPNHEAPGGI